MKKKLRFFYHYNKQTKNMTLHFRKSCFSVSNIICLVPCETKWNKTQPNLVMRGFCNEILIENNIAKIF